MFCRHMATQYRIRIHSCIGIDGSIGMINIPYFRSFVLSVMMMTRDTEIIYESFTLETSSRSLLYLFHQSIFVKKKKNYLVFTLLVVALSHHCRYGKLLIFSFISPENWRGWLGVGGCYKKSWLHFKCPPRATNRVVEISKMLSNLHCCRKNMEY